MSVLIAAALLHAIRLIPSSLSPSKLSLGERPSPLQATSNVETKITGKRFFIWQHEHLLVLATHRQSCHKCSPCSTKLFLKLIIKDFASSFSRSRCQSSHSGDSLVIPLSPALNASDIVSDFQRRNNGSAFQFHRIFFLFHFRSPSHPSPYLESFYMRLQAYQAIPFQLRQHFKLSITPTLDTVV